MRVKATGPRSGGAPYRQKRLSGELGAIPAGRISRCRNGAETVHHLAGDPGQAQTAGTEFEELAECFGRVHVFHVVSLVWVIYRSAAQIGFIESPQQNINR